MVVGKRKRHDSKKFNFGWNLEEDTYQNNDDLDAIKPAASVIGARRRRDDGFDLGRSIRKKDNERTTWREKRLEEMSERDWRIFREDFNISTKGGNVAKPIRHWNECDFLPKELQYTLLDLGYTDPTPIQRQAIPIQIAKRDVIGIAETGSGKTGSFVLPMLSFIAQLPPLVDDLVNAGPYGLILAPTRELAQQIEQETLKLARPLGFFAASIVGGHTLEEQAFRLQNGAEIVIATPGRLRDVLDRRMLVLSQCQYVVLDEADRMVDMGFEADLRFILDKLPRPEKSVQMVMFSATMPPAVEKLARSYLSAPATVIIGTSGQAVHRIHQQVEFISDEQRKRSRLVQILLSKKFEPPIIVFVNQKRSVDVLGRCLSRELGNSLNVTMLHGGKSQEQRELAIRSLKAGHSDILVATDVAGRGLDIKNVSLVVNFDMAKSIEDYTHRIGRTARAGLEGTAISFIDSTHDAHVLNDLKQMLLKSPVSRVPAQLMNHPDVGGKGSGPTKRHEELIYTNY